MTHKTQPSFEKLVEELDADEVHSHTSETDDPIRDLSHVLGPGETVLGDDTPTLQINDEEALTRCLKTVAYAVPRGMSRMPFIDTLTITSKQSFESVQHTQDVRRETAFQNVTLGNVIEGYTRLKAMGIPFTRPQDFMAEMMKTDKQMSKIKNKILDEMHKVKAVEQRKRLKIEKKFAKKVHSERVRAKQRQKNLGLEEIEKWKKTIMKKNPNSINKKQNKTRKK